MSISRNQLTIWFQLVSVWATNSFLLSPDFSCTSSEWPEVRWNRGIRRGAQWWHKESLEHVSSRLLNSCLSCCLGYFLSGLGLPIAHVANVVMGLENAVCLALDDGAQVTRKLAGEGFLIFTFGPVLPLFNAVQN